MMHKFNVNTYSGDWTDFASELAAKIEAGEVTTNELCLYCKDYAAAEALASRYPHAVSELINGNTVAVKFPDGSGAVRFFAHDGAAIPEILSGLGKGDYGSVPLTIRGGLCAGLPSEYWETLRQMVGVPQAISLGSTFSW